MNIHPLPTWVMNMGSERLVSLDERGRVLIPKDIRSRLKAKLFNIELLEDGSIILRPVVNDVMKLAGKFKGLLKCRTIEELKERREEYVKERRGL